MCYGTVINHSTLMNMSHVCYIPSTPHTASHPRALHLPTVAPPLHPPTAPLTAPLVPTPPPQDFTTKHLQLCECYPRIHLTACYKQSMVWYARSKIENNTFSRSGLWLHNASGWLSSQHTCTLNHLRYHNICLYLCLPLGILCYDELFMKA